MWSFYNFKKMFRSSRHSRSLSEVIQKYLQACWPFWSFFNFRKMFRTSRHSRSLSEVIQNQLQASQTFWSFYNFRKMFRISRHSSSLVEVIQRFLHAWWTFWNFYSSRKMFKRFRKRWKNTYLLQPGIEPRPPAWQFAILTTIPWLSDNYQAEVMSLCHTCGREKLASAASTLHMLEVHMWSIYH